MKDTDGGLAMNRMARWCTIAPVAAMTVAGGVQALGAQHGAGSAIFGQVTDSAGMPLASVEVRIAGTTFGARTADDGSFAVFDLPAGSTALQFRRLGYQPLDQTYRTLAADTLRIRVVLQPAPTTLAPTVVKGDASKPARYARTTKYDDFYARREKLSGIFLTREQLDRYPSGRLDGTFGGMPGMKVLRPEPGTFVVFSTRCPASRFTTFIDGTPVRSPDVLSTYLTNEIEAIEVYRSSSELPAAARGFGCGAIFLWTRFHGEQDEP